MANSDPSTASIQAFSVLDRMIHEPARLMIMSYLYIVESGDYTFLMTETGLTWGNLGAHLNKLEEAGYIAIEKGYKGKKPNTMVRLTEPGRAAFQTYRHNLLQALDGLPE